MERGHTDDVWERWGEIPAEPSGIVYRVRCLLARLLGRSI